MEIYPILHQQDLAELMPLIEEYYLDELRHYPYLDQPKRLRLRLTDLERVLSSDSQNHILVVRQQQITGMVVIRNQAWGSDNFGVQMRALEYLIVRPNDCANTLSALLQAVYALCRAENVRHLSIKIDTNLLNYKYALQQDDFYLVDTSMAYIATCNKLNLKQLKPLFNIRKYCIDDLACIKALATQTFNNDRFHNDPHLDNDACNNFYASWVESNLKKLQANYGFVAERNQTVHGFLCFSFNEFIAETTQIKVYDNGLGAVSKNGLGAYPALFFNSIVEAKNQGGEIIVAKTQVNNYEAMKIFALFGLTLANSQYILHKWFAQ